MFTRTENFRQFIRLYPIVSIIISIHIVLYLFTILPFFPNQWFFEAFSGVNLYIMEGQLWRLITPTFMHSGFPHMLFNSFALLLIGPALERLIGSARFSVVYLTSGIIANVATLFLEPLTYTHVGSSGAIFGLFGFYIAIIMFRKRWMTREDTQVILTLCFISLIMTFLQSNINIVAHIFGLLGGFLMGNISYYNKNDLNSSFKDLSNWTVQFKRGFSKQSPLRFIFWGAVILFAIIGLMH